MQIGALNLENVQVLPLSRVFCRILAFNRSYLALNLAIISMRQPTLHLSSINNVRWNQIETYDTNEDVTADAQSRLTSKRIASISVRNNEITAEDIKFVKLFHHIIFCNYTNRYNYIFQQLVLRCGKYIWWQALKIYK